MLACVKFEYDKLKKLNNSEIESKKTYWLRRIYENKYEADKLHIDFHSCELRALMILLREFNDD